MKNARLESIKNEWMAIYDSLKTISDEDILHDSDPALGRIFDRLYQLLTLDIEDHVVNEMLSDQRFQASAKHIARLKTLHGLRMEIGQAREIVAASDPWAFIKGFRFYPNYLKLARMEYQGADLRPKDRVVFLGCGPLPLSLICLCTQHGVSGIGIEQKAEYAALSQKVIGVLGLNAHIRIVQGDHYTLPLKETCDLIMVGADAVPKDDIFEHVANVLPKGIRLSFRIYEKGLRRLVDNSPVSELPAAFREYTRIRPEPPVNNTVVFLVNQSVQ
jgi:hypothetical protein